ncbi:MAG TPA: hypothetical protein VNI83_10910 [Vicinamibacterales bacterium]|nr:hypothetical protein [Vicinamibacterales bacterium]
MLTRRFAAFDRMSPAAIAQIVTTNLTAPMLLARAVVPHLAPGGRIVNVG